MILLNIRLDNIYGFSRFEMGFSYPKRIAESIIGDEFLPGRSNFRYKRVVVLTGANATGKTCLGKALQYITDFINEGNPAVLNSLPLSGGTGSFSIDFVNEGYTLHRVKTQISDIGIGRSYSVTYSRAGITSKDSYESCCKKLTRVKFDDYASLKEYIGTIDCTFSCPEIKPTSKIANVDKQLALKVLKVIIGTLDPFLKEISIARELRNSFIIKRGQEEIIIKEGKLLNRDLLSSGTAEGVDIAFFFALLMSGRNGFYYCDEHFSYIQSNVECKIFALMLEYLGRNGQLIFTSHNMDLLDLNLPKHSFAFLYKKFKPEYVSSVIYASELLKRNTDSVRCAYENDLFSSLPDETLLDELALEGDSNGE